MGKIIAAIHIEGRAFMSGPPAVAWAFVCLRYLGLM